MAVVESTHQHQGFQHLASGEVDLLFRPRASGGLSDIKEMPDRRACLQYQARTLHCSPPFFAS